MKTNLPQSFQHFYLWGVFLGIVSIILGSVIYTAFSIVLKFRFQEYMEDPWFWLVVFGYAVVFTIVPGGIGGGILACLIRRDIRKGIFTKGRSMIMGVLTGLFLGIGLGCVAILVTLDSAHIPLQFALTESMKGMVLSMLAGWWVAGRLVRKVEKQARTSK